MNYADFKAYLARFLLRNGDTVFEADLDNIINMGHARLNRDLRIQRMVVVASTALTSDMIGLPSNYLEMRTITSDSPPAPMQYVSPFERERIKLINASTFQPVYTITGDAIFFVGPMSASDNPARSVILTYYSKIPDFAATNTSWLADDYLDLYTYAVLRHTPTYLKEDERVALWKNEYDETLASVINAEAGRRYAGSPLRAPMPGVVA
jgi:hypothetical protein